MEKLINPDVNAVFIYGAHTDLNSDIEYTENPENTNKFIFPVSKNDKLSDGTVLTGSALVAAFKWIIENKENESANKIQLLEVCGSYNMNNSVYDSEDSTGRSIFSNNNYKGIGC